MDINLKKLLNQTKTFTVPITDRLPSYIPQPCELTCSVQVESFRNYDLLSMETNGAFVVTCQRCLETFNYHYQHQNQLAVCRDDSVAEELMPNFDCIVANNEMINLTEILTDDLHLFVLASHASLDDCTLDKYLNN